MRPNLLFNPVALKELRQLVRSRTIIIGMILYPILLTIVSALTVSFRMQGRTKSDILLGPGLGEAPFYVAAVITGIVVCAALAVTILIAKIIGCILPMLAKKIGFDPAVMASPFITTIVDAVSLLVYFGVATVVLF